MAIYVAVQEVLFLRHLTTNFDHTLAFSTRMLEDNMGCIALATNHDYKQDKHVDISYHFIREGVKSKAVVLEYCPTTDMLTYALTKFSLPTALHLKHVSGMLSGTYAGPPSV